MYLAASKISDSSSAIYTLYLNWRLFGSTLFDIYLVRVDRMKLNNMLVSRRVFLLAELLRELEEICQVDSIDDATEPAVVDDRKTHVPIRQEQFSFRAMVIRGRL